MQASAVELFRIFALVNQKNLFRRKEEFSRRIFPSGLPRRTLDKKNNEKIFRALAPSNEITFTRFTNATSRHHADRSWLLDAMCCELLIDRAATQRWASERSACCGKNDSRVASEFSAGRQIQVPSLHAPGYLARS